MSDQTPDPAPLDVLHDLDEAVTVTMTPEQFTALRDFLTVLRECKAVTCCLPHVLAVAMDVQRSSDRLVETGLQL